MKLTPGKLYEVYDIQKQQMCPMMFIGQRHKANRPWGPTTEYTFLDLDGNIQKRAHLTETEIEHLFGEVKKEYYE